MNQSILFTILQGLVVIALSPLSIGLVRKFKALMQGRQGASVFLPYVSLATLFRKEMVISDSSSWIFRFAPFAVLSTVLFFAFSLPLIFPGQLAVMMPFSNFIFVAAMLATGTLFLVLAGLDVASAFGGMGSEREMTIGSLIEPVVIVTFAAFAVVTGSSNIQEMVGGFSIAEHPVLLLSIAALILLALAENTRYPVDNPATHLELTMVHEATILEYSGPYLAMMELASAIKLTVFALLISQLLIPFSSPEFMHPLTVSAIGAAIIKLVVVIFLLAFLESSIAKMRFYRIQEYITVAFLVGAAGLALAIAGF